jgi:hypothetical protein
MGTVEVKTQTVEQLRDIYYGRKTYRNDVEWLENVTCCIEELCQETGMEHDKLKRANAAKEIGELIIRDVERAKQIANIYGGEE